MWVCVCVQLIADVRELYHLDVSKLGQQLLLIHDKVLLEMQGRKAAGCYISAFNRAAETLDETALNCKFQTFFTLMRLPFLADDSVWLKSFSESMLQKDSHSNSSSCSDNILQQVTQS